jgi:flavodoxin
MKALVTYFSESGNTEKLAQAIYEGVNASAKEIASISEASANEADVIFVGFPVHASSVPTKVEKFIKAIPQGKMVAFFVTHGSLRGGQLAITALHYALSLALNLSVLGTFGCRGQVKPEIIEALLQKPEHNPDDADLKDGREFAALMIGKARNL